MDFSRCIKKRFKEAQALNMIYVQMGKENIDPAIVQMVFKLEVLYSTACIQKNKPVSRFQFDTGGIASIVFGIRIGSGRGASHTS
jgi:hypothetical protein